ncbi:MAG: DUF4382 domain-containing protein [Nitrososphaerota archaeon]|nr:DUF4382 domain-containing protein [Nitrososphaerota archaeon]
MKPKSGLKTITVAVAVVVLVVVAVGAAAVVFLMAPTGSLIVGVKDSPSTGAVSHIYLTISDIVLQGGSSNASTTFKVNATTFDLLALQNVTKMLGKNSVPAGNYTMVRFEVTKAIATVSGTNVTLTVPSGQIKVPMQFSIASGKSTTIVLDITADMTAISASNNLRPTVTGQETAPPS